MLNILDSHYFYLEVFLHNIHVLHNYLKFKKNRYPASTELLHEFDKEIYNRHFNKYLYMYI